MMHFEGNALILHNPTTLCFRGKCRNICIFVKQNDLKASEQMLLSRCKGKYSITSITTITSESHSLPFLFTLLTDNMVVFWVSQFLPPPAFFHLRLRLYNKPGVLHHSVLSTVHYTVVLWLWCTGNIIILEYELLLLLLRIFSLY